jgi:hypothetical protein
VTNRGTLFFLAGALAALGAGWAGLPGVLYERRTQPVDFSHQVHTGAGGMKCEDCHELRADGSFAGVPRLEKCAGCHTAAMGSTAAERNFIDNYVTPRREVRWLIASRQPENAYFSHATHVKLAGLACSECHGARGQSATPPAYEVDRISGYSRDVWRGMTMDDCVACHRRHGLEHSCLDCHK